VHCCTFGHWGSKQSMITGKFVQRFSKIIWFPRKLSTCVCVCVCVRVRVMNILPHVMGGKLASTIRNIETHTVYVFVGNSHGSCILSLIKPAFHDADTDSDSSDTPSSLRQIRAISWSYFCGKLNDTPTFSRRASRGCRQGCRCRCRRREVRAFNSLSHGISFWARSSDRPALV